MSEMNLQDVRDALEQTGRIEFSLNGHSIWTHELIDTIDAHLATPAQTVDVERVISSCRELAKRWIEIDGVSDEYHTGLIQAANELCYRLDAIAVALPRE